MQAQPWPVWKKNWFYFKEAQEPARFWYKDCVSESQELPTVASQYAYSKQFWIVLFVNISLSGQYEKLKHPWLCMALLSNYNTGVLSLLFS